MSPGGSGHPGSPEEVGGGGGLKNGRKSEVLRMSWPIVENVRTSSDIVLDTSRGLQLPYRKKSKNPSFFTENPKIPYFPAIFCLGSLAAVITNWPSHYSFLCLVGGLKQAV